MVKQNSQQGAAAIELALTLILLLMLFFAVISYGSLFLAQQKLSHLAGEGARTAVAASFQGKSKAEALEAGCARADYLREHDFLLASLTAEPCAISPSSQVASCHFAAPYPCATLEIKGQVSGWPLLNMMRSLAGVFTSDTSAILPEFLSAKAVVQLNAES